MSLVWKKKFALRQNGEMLGLEDLNASVYNDVN